MALVNSTVTISNPIPPPTSQKVLGTDGSFTLPWRMYFQSGPTTANSIVGAFNEHLQEELALLAAIQNNAKALQNTVTSLVDFGIQVEADVANAVADVDGLATSILLGQMVSTATYAQLNDVAYVEGIPIGTVVQDVVVQQDGVNSEYAENFHLLGGRLNGSDVGWLLSNSFVYVDPTTTLTVAFTQQTAYTDSQFAIANTEIVTLSSTIGAVSQELTQLTADTASEFANVTVQLDAVSTLSNASALSLTFLGVADDAGSTFSLNETTVFVGNTGNSLGQTLTGLNANIGNNTALIDTESSVRASQTSALANSITVVSTQVGNNTASITTLQTSTNGLEARYGVALDVNGFVTGWEQNNNGSLGSMTILVNNFAVVTPGVSPFVPFDIIGGTVFIPHAVVGTLDVNTVNANNINVGAVTTPGINNGAVSNILTASSSSTIVQNSYQSLLSSPISMTLSYGATVIIGGFAYGNDGGGHGSSSHTSRVGIVVNGAEVNFNLVANNPWAVDQALYVQAQLNLGAGTYTVDLWGSATNNDFFTQREIYAQWFYR